MKVLTFREKVFVVRNIAKMLVYSHFSHERRNERLAAFQVLLESYIKDFTNSYYYDANEKWSFIRFFETCNELAIWQQDYETHICVKNRMRLIVDLCDFTCAELDYKQQGNNLSRKTSSLVICD